MIKDGIEKNFIRIINVPFGVACQIGIESEDNFFYFGGTDTDNVSAEEYKASYTKEEIAEEIFRALEDLGCDPFFESEYDRYEEYLTEKLYGNSKKTIPDLSTRKLWDLFIQKLTNEKDSYAGSVKINDKGYAYFGKDSEKVYDMERILKTAKKYDIVQLKADAGKEEWFRRNLIFLLSCKTVFPYFVKRLNHAEEERSVERAVISGIDRAIENLDFTYAVLLFEKDLAPANFYKVPHVPGIEKDPEKTKNALLKLAEKDFGKYFEKDKWAFDAGIFANGAIKFTDTDNKTYIYELMSAVDIRSIGYDEALLLLEKGRLPLDTNLSYEREKK